MTGKQFDQLKRLHKFAEDSFEAGDFDDDGEEACAIDTIEEYLNKVDSLNEDYDDDTILIDEEEDDDDNEDEPIAIVDSEEKVEVTE